MSTVKHHVQHADNGSGMYKADFAGYDFSLLSGDLDIDPIIDEPMEMTSPPGARADQLRARASLVTFFYKTHPHHYAL